MEKVTRLEDLRPLLDAQLQRGVCTNAFFTPEEYGDLIARNALSCEVWEGGLALLVHRGDYDRLYFYLHGELKPITLTRPTVLEIAYRPKDLALQDAGTQWEKIGFQRRLTRVRLCRPAVKPALAAELARPEEYPQVLALMEDCFDHRMGCIPTLDELSHVLCLRKNGICAILHYKEGRQNTVAHLAVRADCRRQGYGTRLLSMLEEKRTLVWTGQDNLPGIKLYEAAGFTPESWRSGVWLL